jgi:thiamine pyrophosphate-dependent acetolactate synthase large subunit-like protein
MVDMDRMLIDRPGVVITQGDLMASNATFGILEAYLDGSPMLIIADVTAYNGLSQHGP